MGKHLVISGCSFTQHNRPETWYHNLKTDYDHPDVAEIHNVGIGGAGNYIISTMCINKVSELLKEGVRPEDVYVVIQWSGVSRKSFIGDNRPSILPVDFSHCQAESEIKTLAAAGGSSKFCWDIGKKNDERYWINYKDNYWSDECAFIETLENILRVQWFLKSSGVDFLMFLGWDIFTNPDSGQHMHGSWAGWFKANDGRGQWDKKLPYVNSQNALLKDEFRWSTHLWRMIDFSCFTFFENPKIKLGGMMQWGQYNLPSSLWYCAANDPHPSQHVQTGFYNAHIRPWLWERM
jgi:hypothetical protein|tara:strand:+ start:1253 stop:2128 length:876 start_codon:yes stop_codon:yes gene_type:complete